MGSFGYKDERIREIAPRSWPAETARMLARHAHAALIVVAALLAAYAADVVFGLHVHAQTSGALSGIPVQYQTLIVRDRRGIAHIRARSLHDLFVAQGFAEASDRLFEMELTRRYAYGTLAEVFGEKALPIDETQRAVDIRDIAQREWQASDAQTRATLRALSDGINAAIASQPLPVEFRMLMYRPARWRPQDSLAVAIVAMLELSDSWRDVEERSKVWNAAGPRCFDRLMPLSDERYDVTIDARTLSAAAAPQTAADCPLNVASSVPARPHLGSNAWAAGAARTTTHRALVANDPHVDLTIPGIWYVIDLRAPGLHAAGAVVPGLPGVTIGHNERVAWAVTNAQAATTAVYHCAAPPARFRVRERFNVRFGAPLVRTYYRTPELFSVPDGSEDGATLVRWLPYSQRTSPVATNIRLDSSRSIAQTAQILLAYRGSPENFVMADTSGAVAYRLAGEILNDAAWGRYVHEGCGFASSGRAVPANALPARAARRDALVVSANNRMYGARYPYRLSAAFELPYRAYRIAQLLHARTRYSPQYFAAMQMDTYSPLDAEIAARVGRMAANGALLRWDGRFEPSSARALLAHRVREYFAGEGATIPQMLADLRLSNARERIGVARDVRASLWTARYPVPAWGNAGRVRIEHPLSPMWYGLLSGATLPGDGDEFTIHLQEPGFAQGFRAVWDVGNWDGGGIVMPSGESGEPGSPHYDDLSRDWIGGAMVALPFSQRAVDRAASAALILRR